MRNESLQGMGNKAFICDFEGFTVLFTKDKYTHCSC